ncbi:GNAT family N-acetyltransferase [Streptomyces sp. 184]|uniref:GNAT family N-acetyltransferase n=1 Tax=Streptomyces sp. 184 TaxID=1827526 RepID=UPI0038915CA0
MDPAAPDDTNTAPTEPTAPAPPTPTPALLDAPALADAPRLAADFPAAAHRILAALVRDGAALGWVDPPGPAEVAALLDDVLAAARAGDAALRAAYLGDRLLGLGYWLRYTRPTHRPHADLEKLAVAADAHGRGIGRALTAALVADARAAGIEVLTLDARGDNGSALRLYRSLGFTEYGRLPGFVAVGERRYDKVFHMLDLRPPTGSPEKAPESARKDASNSAPTSTSAGAPTTGPT